LLTLPQQRHQPWAGIALKFLQRAKFSEQSCGFGAELVGRPVGDRACHAMQTSPAIIAGFGGGEKVRKVEAVFCSWIVHLI
jgi:hypothetical protein